MIGSFILSLVLLIAASFGWGFVFLFDTVRLGKRELAVAIVLSAILCVLSAVFFAKSLNQWGNEPDLLGASTFFVLAFVLSLGCGFVISAYRGSARLIGHLDSMIRGSETKDDREDIIDEILDLSSEKGQINILERELIESVLKFNDKTVREVMIPRGDVVVINIDEDSRLLLHRVIEEGYSRLPVYRNSIDNIVGIIYAKDLLTMVENGAVIVLQDLLRPPYYVPVTKKISQLLREMQRDRIHLAVAVDEFGGTEGIVTLEDVLEEIVGDIQDEYDENPSELVTDPNGDVHIAGLTTVNRFNELLESNIPQSGDYDTMAGFVQKLAGKIPQKGEIYNYQEMFFIIEEVARHRIRRLRISFKEHPNQAMGSAEIQKLTKNPDDLERLKQSPSATASKENKDLRFSRGPKAGAHSGKPKRSTGKSRTTAGRGGRKGKDNKG